MKAIITDYDYTLSDKFMTVELLFLLEEKKIIEGYVKDYKKVRADYETGKKSYNEFVYADMENIKRYLEGVEYMDVVRVLREDFNPEKNVFDWTKEIKNIFRPEEWLFIVVSSSMDLCIEKMQDHLGFDTYYCSSYEVKDQKFTGEFRCQVKSEEKGRYVKQLSRDLEKIVVVGDAPGDFEMIEFGSSAYLFEPDENTLAEKKKSKLDCEIVDRNNILEKLKTEV
jgi:HAD superfamily phosphoserine phosphatase-like hydrolase